MSEKNCFDGIGGWIAYRHLIDCPGIPTRMKNAIESELNAAVIGSVCMFDIPSEVNIQESIPAWLVVKWIEAGNMKRLPNVGVKTINDTLLAIAHCLSE